MFAAWWVAAWWLSLGAGKRIRRMLLSGLIQEGQDMWSGDYPNVRYTFSIGNPAPYARPPENFALKTVIKGEDIFLLQVGGGGRILIGNDRKCWWTKPSGIRWKIVPSQFGLQFFTREEAALVKANMERQHGDLHPSE